MQTKQLKLTAIIHLFGHIACMDDNVDAKRIMLALPHGDSTPGRPRITWLSTIQHDLKQSTWLRIALCGGCCRCQALHNL